MSGLQLIATGGAIPGRTVTNEDLSRMVDTSDEWITSRTGIRTRHWCTEDLPPRWPFPPQSRLWPAAALPLRRSGAASVPPCPPQTRPPV